MDGNQAKRTRAPAHLAPVVLVGRGGAQVGVFGVGVDVLGADQRGQLFGQSAVGLSLARQATHSAAPKSVVKHRPGARPLFWIRAARVVVNE